MPLGGLIDILEIKVKKAAGDNRFRQFNMQRCSIYESEVIPQRKI